MTKEILPVVKVNWKTAGFAIAGIIIAIIILVVVKLSPYFKSPINPIS